MEKVDRKKSTITEKEVKEMKKRGWRRSGLSFVLGFCVLFMAVLLGQTPAQCQVNCAAPGAGDSDGDGLTDAQECAGITLADGSHFPGKLEGISSQLPRGQYLDPDTKDLFVIIVPAAQNSNVPANPLEFLSKTLAEGGLEITTHLIPVTQAGPGREITPLQKAVKVTESLDTSDPNLLGMANCGTPNGLDLATVFTERIKNHVNSVYQAAGSTPPPGSVETYIKHTIAHEIGHMLGPLAPTYNERFGGYHYKSGTNVILDQSVYYTVKGGNVTFYVGTKYTSADQTGAKLK